MSSDDPTDDELEREAARDVPASLGNLRHAPKLSRESRAINPRALLEAERAAQSVEPVRPLLDFPDIGEHMARMEREQYRGSLVGIPRRQQSAGLRRPAPAPATPPVSGTATVAWDRYLAAALVVAAQIGVEDVEGTALDVADRLLEERRRRFG